MQFAADAGDWWCSHCHHRVEATATPLPVARTMRASSEMAAAAPLPSPAPVEAAPQRAPSAAPVPRAGTAPESRPVVVAAPARRLGPAIGAGVLAMIAIGMVGAVLVRCGGGAETEGLDRDRLMTLAPPGTQRVQGMNLYGLRRSELGREMAVGLTRSPADDTTRRACGFAVEDQIDWAVGVHSPDDAFGTSLTVLGLAIDTDGAEDCLRKALRVEGEDLAVDQSGALRAYRFDDRSMWGAWLDPHTVAFASWWSDDGGRADLERAVERQEPAPDNRELARAMARVDTGASFWLAMVRPSADLDSELETDGVERWFDRDLSGLLGARPESAYLSLDVRPGVIEVRGGAFYTSESKAARVGERLTLAVERAGQAGGMSLPDMDGIDPVLREDIERRLREGASKAQALRGALWRNARVEVDGEAVTVSSEVRGDELEAVRAARSPAGLLAEINGWLPHALRPRM